MSCMTCRWCSCRDYGKEKGSGSCMYYIEIPKDDKEEIEDKEKIDVD